MTTSFRTTLADAAATERAGRAFARALRGGMVVTLSGDLGAGKTTFARGVLRGLGWTGAVKSPTYTLLEHYPLSNIYLYHFDFYRFADPDEWETAGLAECFRSDSACLVEWPELAAGVVPAADIKITLKLAGVGRELEIDADTEAGRRCIRKLKEKK